MLIMPFVRIEGRREEVIQMVKITLKDKSVMEIENGASVYDAAKKISDGLARAALGARVDGEVKELTFKLEKDAELEILTFDDNDGRHILRHTASHVMAQAVKRLFPEVKLAIGPAIDNGFYYDFDYDKGFTPDDLAKIEAEMNKIVKENYKLERFELPRKEAIEFMKEKDEPYKVELIEDLPEDAVISFYRQGDFTDLCAGPHLFSTGAVKAFKLLNIAGAYWRGSEKNKMLQRIYGTAFTKKAEMQAYLDALEEAKKRDHRKLGRELGLFMMAPVFRSFFPRV